jgi:hypothetical protein
MYLCLPSKCSFVVGDFYVPVIGGIKIEIINHKDRQCVHNHNTEARLPNHFCLTKQEVLYILSVSATLVIQHAKHIHSMMLPSMGCLAVPYFPHYLIMTIFGKKLLNIKCED